MSGVLTAEGRGAMRLNITIGSLHAHRNKPSFLFVDLILNSLLVLLHLDVCGHIAHKLIRKVPHATAL